MGWKEVLEQDTLQWTRFECVMDSMRLPLMRVMRVKWCWNYKNAMSWHFCWQWRWHYLKTLRKICVVVDSLSGDKNALPSWNFFLRGEQGYGCEDDMWQSSSTYPSQAMSVWYLQYARNNLHGTLFSYFSTMLRRLGEMRDDNKRPREGTKLLHRAFCYQTMLETMSWTWLDGKHVWTLHCFR